MNKIIRHFRDCASAEQYLIRARSFPGVQSVNRYSRGSHYSCMVVAVSEFSEEVYNALLENSKNYAIEGTQRKRHKTVHLESLKPSEGK